VWAVVSLALAGLILAAFMSLHDIRAPEALQETRERWKPKDKEGALGGRGFESRRLALQLVPFGLAFGIALALGELGALAFGVYALVRGGRRDQWVAGARTGGRDNQRENGREP
jgi:hypothetical protein